MDNTTRLLTVSVVGSMASAAFGYVFDSPAHINLWAVIGLIPALVMRYMLAPSSHAPEDRRTERQTMESHPNCHCTNCMNAHAREQGT